jgi:phosphate starvation-inducible PhoH-like protein
LKDVEGINFSQFTEVDVVRHPLVQEVIRAYDRAEAEAKVEAQQQAEPPAAGAAAASTAPSVPTPETEESSS